MENLAEEPKITQKINPKTNKTKLNLKKSKEPELTKIDEFLEYGKFKNIFIDTCVLKDLNALFLNKADPDKNENENNVIGFSIDTNNHTIFKFNKTPHKFEIERFVLPDKEKKNINKYNDYINDSVGKINLNNISENKGHTNFLRSSYQSESEKSTKKKKQINSNIIANSSKIKKRLKEKNAATILENVNINEILNESKSRKKKKKKSVKEKENKNKINDKDVDKEEKSKINEKDNYKEDNYNINTLIVRKNKKSKTKKHSESLRFPKTKIIKRSTNNLHFTNIKKISIDRNNGDKEDESVMFDNNKKMSKKFNTKNNNRLRTSTKSCFINCDDDLKSKKNRKKKYIKFRSEIYSKKNQNPINNYKNKLVQRKQSEIIFNKKKNDDENNSFKNDVENDNFYSDKSKSSKDSDYSSLKIKNKENRQSNKNIDDLNILKFESEKNPYNINRKSENSSELVSKDSEQNKLKISSSKKSSYFQIKKVNEICLGDNVNGQRK